MLTNKAWKEEVKKADRAFEVARERQEKAFAAKVSYFDIFFRPKKYNAICIEIENAGAAYRTALENIGRVYALPHSYEN